MDVCVGNTVCPQYGFLASVPNVCQKENKKKKKKKKKGKTQASTQQLHSNECDTSLWKKKTSAELLA